MRKKKRLRTLIALIAVSVFVSTAIVYAEPSSKEAQKKVDNLKQKKKETQKEISSLQTQLTTILGKLDELENSLVKKQKQIEGAESDLKEAKANEKEQYKDMKTRIVYMYEEGTSSAELEKIMTSQSISEMLSNVEYAQDLHNYDRNKLDELVATKKKIQKLTRKLKSQKAEMEDMQAEYESQSNDLNSLINEKSAEIKNLGSQIQSAAKEVEKAKKREAAEAAAKAAQQAAANSGNTDSSQTTDQTTQQTTTKKVNVSGANKHGSAIVSAAYSQLGVPYVWGGTTPGKGLDCSGLTQYCYSCAGISIPRTSSAQLAGGTIVSNPSPGDICWTPGHVAIYIGNGKMIEAQQTGVPVKISAVRVTYYVRY